MTGRVLVIDDERGIRDALKQILAYEKLEVRVAGSGGEGLLTYEAFRPHVVLLDVKMAGLDGLEILKRLRRYVPPATVIMISGHATIATAVQATQQGALDFLEKPLDADRLISAVRNGIAQTEMTDEHEDLKAALKTPYAMVGRSPALRAVRELIERVGPTEARVLITGENGTGKELVARAIHRASPRSEAAFIEVNCAAIPTELIESELFGHLKGSFTSASTDRAGRFELADKGTLFLDEIGDMSLSAQAKVLRTLQEGIVTRIGASKPVKVDVRVLSATNKDVEQEIAAGRFREDLFYRLNVVPIRVPPLRERREDIPDLVTHFAALLGRRPGIDRKIFGVDAIERLMARDWPGNVRELRNAVERLLILSTERTIDAADVDRLLPAPGEAPTAGSDDGESGAGLRALIVQKLAEHKWSITEAAKALGMPRSSLYRYIERFGLTQEPE